MALLLMDSFDHYAIADITEKWTQLSASPTITPTINSSAGRHGSSAIRWSSAINGAGKTLRSVLNPAPSGATCVVGFAFTHTGGFANLGSGIANDPNAINSSNTGCPGIFYVLASGTTQVYAVLNSSGTISVYRASTTTGVLLGTTSAALSAGVVTYIEISVLIDNSAGTVSVRFNGAEVLALTSQDTLNTSATWTEIGIGHLCAGNTGISWDYDDLYCLDGSGGAPWNARLGDSRVDAGLPTAAGTTTGWTPSAGANYQCVDETAPNDDTDYTSASTVGLTDTYVVPDAPSTGVIQGVQVNIACKKMDAGSASVAPVVRIGSTDYVGTAQNPGTTYAYLRSVYATSPATATGWTVAEFNGAEFGYQKTV